MIAVQKIIKCLCLQLILIQAGSYGSEVPPSLFHDNAEQIAASMKHAYDPILASVMASVVSRRPRRENKEWQELRLGNEGFADESSAFFASDVPVQFRDGGRLGAPVFLIIPGSFATWKRGAFVNQTAAALDRVSPVKPHLLVFPGLFSPEFLKGRCNQVPSDFEAIARDLYLRIRPVIRQIGSRSVGIIGYSGGATIALRMAVIDRELFPDSPVFNAGVIASSPILDLRHSFRLLDSAFKDVRISHKKGLTTADLKNVVQKVRGLFKNVCQQIFAFFDRSPDEFRDRFYNEFFTVDLMGVVKATGQEAFLESGLPFTYSDFFEKYSSTDSSESLYRNNLRPVLETIEIPTLLHFPKDDPVLSRRIGTTETPNIIEEILGLAQDNPYIQVVDPETGGHTGLLLEPKFDLILREFFFSRPQSIEFSPRNNFPRY